MTLCGSGKLYLDPTAMLEYKARADIPDSVTTDLLLIFPPHMITNFTDSGTTKNATYLYAFFVQPANGSHTPESYFVKTTP